MVKRLNKRLREIPRDPGVYLFKNSYGNVLYVGKANVLVERVRSYFRSSGELSSVKQLMVQQIANIDTIAVRNEEEAVALEDQLIKDYQPRYNILAKDDKSYLYVHITDEEFPRVLLVRRPDPSHDGQFFGPYPFARSIRNVLKLLVTVFPHRTCRTLPKRACLEYYLGHCPAPCIEKISVEGYRRRIDKIIAFLEGKAGELPKHLEEEMQRASVAQKYEYAARLRNQLHALHTLTAIKRTPLHYLREQLKTKAIDPSLGLIQLQEALGFKKSLRRIEIYDISHHHGQYTVGSMVVFTDGIPDIAEYRRFRIRTVVGIDDVKSLCEVVTRRLNKNWPLPDLAIMDGGMGQLHAVADLWKAAGIPVIALAKRREEIFVVVDPLPRRLPEGSQGLFLIQRMRDEAHRFAIQYYRLLHRKSLRAKKCKAYALSTTT